MIDPFDLASQSEANFREDAEAATLAAIRAAAAKRMAEHPESAEFCEFSDCGLPIPQRRREAQPGCRFCVDCQSRVDKNPALKRRYP